MFDHQPSPRKEEFPLVPVIIMTVLAAGFILIGVIAPLLAVAGK